MSLLSTRSLLPALPVLATMLTIGLATPSSAQTSLYGQNAYSLGDYHWDFNFSSSNGITVIQNGTTYGPFGPYLTYDNFTLPSTSQVGSVTWEGLTIADPSFGLGHQGVEPSTFTIEFLSDNAGLPGSVINSQTVSPTTTYVTQGNLYDDDALENIYSYSANLNATPALQAGTQYWISIIGNTSGDNGWGWVSGEPGDGSAYQIDGTDSSQDGFAQYDRSFNLSSPAPAPEPSSLVSLLVAGGLLIALRFVAFMTRKKSKPVV